MAKEKPNANCEECNAPFFAKTDHNKCCSTACRMAHHKKVLAQREANDKARANA